MINIFKQYYVGIFIIIILGILLFNYFFIQKYKNSYKDEGLYAVGTIKEVKGYGKGSGYDCVYVFSVKGKEYKAVCSTGKLSFIQFQDKINNQFLVLYLKSNIYLLCI